MRILHLIPTLSGGGAERQLSYLAPALARLGHEVHIAYERNGPLKPALSNISLHRLRSRSSYDLYLLWQFIRLVRTVKPDVINTWIIQSDVICAITTRFTGTPWILREPGSAMGHPPSWKNRLRVRAASYASAIVSNSLGGDLYWKAQLPDSIRYKIPNGIPVSEIRSTAPGFSASLPFRNGVPLIMYAGRLASDESATKNLKPLLHALTYIKKRRDFFAVICGEGPQMPELQELCRVLELKSNVIFTGFLPASEVWALMKEATLFISLSSHEGAPNTVMEAMTCGCPLVLSDIPAHRELLEERTAFFVNPLDIQETANTIMHVLDDPEDARQHARFAQSRVEEWSVEKLAREYELVYKSVT